MLNIVSALVAFNVGFLKALFSSAGSTFFLLPALKFLAGNKLEKAVEILAHNYSIAFSAYIFSSLTFGITGIFFLFSSFLLLGVTATKTNSIYYLLFIIFESLGFLLNIYFSINTRHYIKLNGFKSSKNIVVKDLFFVFIILALGAFFESIILT